MLVLAIGDLHIPHRAIDLPAKFKKLLTPGKISQVLCLGNTTTSPSTLAFLQSLSPDFQLVKGEYDISTANTLPLSLIVTHGSLRIGFLNGFTVIPRGDPLSLLTLARQWNVDVLLWGNGSGVEAYTLEGKFFVNPGSATGAWCGDWEGEEIADESQELDILVDKASKLDIKDDEVEKIESQEEKEKNIEHASEEVHTEELTKEQASISPITTPDQIQKSEKEEESSDSDSDYDPNDLYDTIPSFTLLDIQGTTITLYIYTLINGEVKVDKVNYRKPAQLE